jgi:hypothetical protein
MDQWGRLKGKFAGTICRRQGPEKKDTLPPVWLPLRLCCSSPEAMAGSKPHLMRPGGYHYQRVELLKSQIQAGKAGRTGRQREEYIRSTYRFLTDLTVLPAFVLIHVFYSMNLILQPKI